MRASHLFSVHRLHDEERVKVMYMMKENEHRFVHSMSKILE